MNATIALTVTLLNDELFDPSTSPPAKKSARYFEAWQDGYDAALNRVLERLQAADSASGGGAKPISGRTT